jgi:hypothetical protein
MYCRLIALEGIELDIQNPAWLTTARNHKLNSFRWFVQGQRREIAELVEALRGVERANQIFSRTPRLSQFESECSARGRKSQVDNRAVESVAEEVLLIQLRRHRN